MRQFLFFIMILVIFPSCRNSAPKGQNNRADNDSINNNFRIEETFIDSVSLGIKGKFKIKVQQIRKDTDGVYMSLDLFINKAGQWIKKQSYKTQKDGISSLNVVISDFNNDGLNDMTVQTNVAARGSNEIKSLFLFDRTNEELKLIENSTNYPNLRYNQELNCIDAWLVYGGSTTLFLKLDADTLREFAGVELFDNVLTVYQINESGKKIELTTRMEDKLDTYTRFENFKPLKISKENK